MNSSIQTPSVNPHYGLWVAAAVSGLEGAVFVVLAGLEALALVRGPLVMVLTTTVFFLAYGAFLLFAARGLLRRNVWWRGPVVMAQLIQLFVAAGFWGGQTRWVSVCLVGLAAAALVGLFLPSTTKLLERG